MKKVSTMIYLFKGNKILFLERKKENDKVHKQGMHIPMGGKVEKGESLKECVIREAKEESGIKVNQVELRGIIYFRSFGEEQEDWVGFLYTSTDFKGEPKNGNEGNLLWVDKKDINKLSLYKGDKIFLDYILNKKYKFFVAEFLYKGFVLKDYKLLYKA